MSMSALHAIAYEAGFVFHSSRMLSLFGVHMISCVLFLYLQAKVTCRLIAAFIFHLGGKRGNYDRVKNTSRSSVAKKNPPKRKRATIRVLSGKKGRRGKKSEKNCSQPPFPFRERLPPLGLTLDSLAARGPHVWWGGELHKRQVNLEN